MEQQGSEPALRSHLSSHSSAKFYFLCYPFTCLLPSLLTSWFGQPPATSCDDWALAGKVGLYKMEGLTPHLHHKQGWISIKWRGPTPHLHHNTVALWESRGIGAAGVRTSTQKPSQLSLFCKVLLPLLSFHIFATIPLDFLVWATSCHILRRLGPCCILPEPVSCLLVLFFTRMILRRSDIASYGRQF